MRTLVLGLGNELYGDDGVGIYIIEDLKNELIGEEKYSAVYPGPDGPIEFIASNSTGLALLDLILGYDRLIIIDTIKVDHPQTGRVSILKEEDLRAIPGPSPHYLSFPQILQIGRAAGLPVPRELTIVAIESKNIACLGEKLSAEMKASFPKILNLIKSLLGLRETADESKRNNYS
ncbi:MAG: hydrogenase maturation protease [Candidatus Aminicenantes bacterium]|nr:hydrogenase maturation protease [Candidatus Aminicenantes bacterium]